MNTNGFLKGSVSSMKNLKSLVVTGMLLALHLVLAVFVTLPLTDTVRISVAFITNVVTGYLYGPWMALITGALGDVLQLMIKPTGPWFFGWTLNAALGGMLYGLFFYRKSPKEPETVTELPQQEKKVRIVQLLTMGLPVLMLLAWFVMPFLTVTTKATTEMPEVSVLAEGTALQHLLSLFQGSGSKSSGMLALAALVFVVLILVFAVVRKKIPVMLVSILGILWLLLPVYTDRKVMEVQSGFALISAGLVLCLLFMLLAVLWQHSLDGFYLLRCFFVMAIVAIVIQMFLGTYWCTVMYGKGFWFYFVPRAIKSLIQLPFNTVLAYYVIAAVKRFRLVQ
ncbi:MAG: folate family ECF transporter S component [Lachnospiraceae bacterium]|nr:folate family ECF transporter S component [Lachnospiraceae bacterium]